MPYISSKEVKVIREKLKLTSEPESGKTVFMKKGAPIPLAECLKK